MKMYNLVEQIESYLKTSGNLWQCYRDELVLAANGAIIDFPVANSNSASFNFKQEKHLKQKIMV